MQLARLFETPRRTLLTALVLSAAAWLAIWAGFNDGLNTVEEHTGDWAWRMAAGQEQERRVILVDIDENSLRESGAWPWPRDRLAALSDRLAAEGAALQVVDIVMPSPAGGDDVLRSALKRNNAILSQVFALEPGAEARSGMPGHPLAWTACPAPFPEARGYIANDAALADIRVGHITPKIGKDGIVRHVPAIVCFDGKPYPALFLAAFLKSNEGERLSLASGGPFGPAWKLNGLSMYPRGIPVDALGNVRVPWRTPQDRFIALSASDVLAGRVPAGMLQNAWVVVGSTALGLADRVATPLQNVSAGLLVHTELIRGVLDETIPREPRHQSRLSLLLALAGVTVVATLGRFRRKPVYVVMVTAVALVVLLVVAKIALLIFASLWIGWVWPAVYILCFALCLSLIEHAKARFDSNRLYAHLSSYLPAEVAAALAKRDPSDAIEAARRDVTVMYADIRNFSIYGETRPPEETTAVLHAFFSMATQVVERHGGRVEAFQGDAVLAIWAARSGDDDGGRIAERALAAALAILRESRAILPDPRSSGLPELELGIGLETGVATVGSFGLARRRTHLAFGEAVTTAIRLQEMTAELAHPILLGEGIAALIGGHRLESLGVFLLEGMRMPRHIHGYPLKDCVF